MCSRNEAELSWTSSGLDFLVRLDRSVRVRRRPSRRMSPRPRHDLRPGHADPSSFPRQAWAAAMRRVLAEAPDEAFGYADPRRAG